MVYLICHLGLHYIPPSTTQRLVEENNFLSYKHLMITQNPLFCDQKVALCTAKDFVLKEDTGSIINEH